MLLRSNHDLHYPITVTELLKQPNDNVERLAPLFSYTYKSMVTEGNKYGEEHRVEKTFPSVFESEIVGKLLRWSIEPHTVITRSNVPLVEIEEPCKHEVQYGGMCAICGADMTVMTYNTSIPDTARANIRMTHGNVNLTVSEDAATRAEEDSKRRLLQSRKLALVVDLDQTIIQATVDPTVAEWQKDENNPNYPAVKDVQAFQLVDEAPGARGCWYYVKKRPGLDKFLRDMSKLYEMHVYTMGTRAYAQNIAKIVDPDGRIFGDRILSRDESGSLVFKTLKRLFPVDTRMVVIIDDRADVWQWSEHLFKVKQFDFFVGVGDINSTFLPKTNQDSVSKPSTTERAAAPGPTADQTEAAAHETSKPKPGPEEKQDSPGTEDSNTAGITNGAVSDLEQLAQMGERDDPMKLQQQVTENNEALAAQMEDRPLLRKQQMLDKQDEDANQAAATNGDNGNKAEDSPRHNLLHDDDNELEHMGATLRRVHEAFYTEYDRRLSGSQGGRIAELRDGRRAKKTAVDDLAIVPNIKDIMPNMKRRVLRGVNLVFSGVVPLGFSIHIADLAVWAKSFGAELSEDVVKNRTTHVIAAKQRRTAKVRQAMKYPRIKIVSTDWLYSCFSQWKRVSEQPYLIHVEHDHGKKANSSGSASPFDEELDEGAKLSSSEEDAAAATEDENEGHGLSINTNITEDDKGLELNSAMDDNSPIGTDKIWDEMRNELDDFLGSDAYESDSDGGSSVKSGFSAGNEQTTPGGRKRKRPTSNPEATDGAESDVSTASHDSSRLHRRKRRTMDRVSSLTKGDHASDLAPLDDLAADVRGDGGKDGDDDDDDDGDAELTRLLEAELTKDSDDEEEQEGAS